MNIERIQIWSVPYSLEASIKDLQAIQKLMDGRALEFRSKLDVILDVEAAEIERHQLTQTITKSASWVEEKMVYQSPVLLFGMNQLFKIPPNNILFEKLNKGLKDHHKSHLFVYYSEPIMNFLKIVS